MALINCKDCNAQISDSAEACPHCGAPVPRTIGEDEEACPFCMTIVHKDATTCPNCLAKKGYMYEPRYGVFGKVGVLVWGVIFPVAITIPLPVIGIGTLPFALYATYRLITGPRWFQTRHA